MKDKIFSVLQRVGRSFMLPIAILPVAGLLLGIGSSFTNATTIETYGLTKILGEGTLLHSLLVIMNSVGSAVFDNLPLIFAVGVAIGMAKKEKEVAALSAVIAFFVMNTAINAMLTVTGQILDNGQVAETVLEGTITSVCGIQSLQMGVFGGIIVGLGVAALHNRFYRIQLPNALSFFGGTRFVPIISTIVYMFVGILLYFVWPVVQNGIYALGGLVTGTGYVGTLIFGLIKRALIPFGLHHVFYMPFRQTAVGGTMEVAGKMVQGGQNIFFAQLADSANIAHFSADATRYFSGEFIFMIFGLPGAALAMYQCAKPEKKKAAGGLLLSAALACMATGITEPLEFSFLFVAPALFAVQVVLAGSAYMIAHMLNIAVGLTFSGGFLDFFLFGILQGNTKTSWLHVIPVGILYFIVYFIVFRVMILKFNYQTPGHEKDNATPVNNADNKSQQILDGLGGLENISDLSCCATRLRVTLHRPSKLNKEKLLATGAAAVVANGDGVQVVYGPEVTVIHARLQDYIAQIIPASSSTADNSAAVPTTSAEVSNPAVSAEAKDSDNLSVADAITDIVYAPCNGTVIPLKEINDGVFSEGYIGEGLAIEPVDGSFYAPFDCSVAMVFDTHHAIALHTANDTELILHVGLDTVKLNGQHLEVFVQEGQKIQKGDLILRADLEGIQSAGCRTVTPVVITGAGGAESVELLKTGPVHIGDAVLKVHY